MARSADEVAQAWVDGLSGAGSKIAAGVDSVTTSPGQAAARQKAVWLQQVQASQDKWASAVSKVTTADWQASMKDKGIPRMASGAAASRAKMASFLGRLLPYVASGRSNLPARGTFEQNKQRASAWMDYMHRFSNR